MYLSIPIDFKQQQFRLVITVTEYPNSDRKKLMGVCLDMLVMLLNTSGVYKFKPYFFNCNSKFNINL